MKSKILILTLLSLATILMGCDKEEDTIIPNGVYKGIFTVTYPSESLSGQTTLELKNGKFTCSANPDRIPAGGSGTFSINEHSIIFTDENRWTTDFDGNLILDGKYDYTFDGKKLIISANKNDVGLYKYDLEKQ